ncbi:MAG TPA: LytTR family DNA-binding domain-containing protein [Bacteroidales bacterium]|nr:LytTR family DNA-binding domain-containing protein [Bacteroidales bacterium]
MPSLKHKSFSDEFSLRYELTVTFIISLIIFLFILFFQPFDTEQFSLNNAVLFLAGFGGINFVFMGLFMIVLPAIVPAWYPEEHLEHGPGNMVLALIWIFDSSAFGFYIHFVGMIPLSMFIMFKVILLCLAAVVILKVLYINRSLKNEIDFLNEKIRENHEIMKKLDSDQEDVTIEIYSDNRSDKVTMKVKDLILLRSADNYVEVVYYENGARSKKLIRNTLKNLEYQLSKFQKFIRCHRSYMVNLSVVEKLQRKSNGYYIEVKGMDEPLPVSRQYLLKLRDALEIR